MSSHTMTPINVNDLVNGDTCFIVGNKGLGKTATLRYEEKQLRKNPSTISTFNLFDRKALLIYLRILEIIRIVFLKKQPRGRMIL